MIFYKSITQGAPFAVYFYALRDIYGPSGISGAEFKYVILQIWFLHYAVNCNFDIISNVE